MRNKVIFDYGQKKFVNMEAEDDIAESMRKNIPTMYMSQLCMTMG